MSSHIAVMKFGGTSIEDAPAFARVGRIVGDQDRDCLVVVVSAMSRVTDALIRAVRIASETGATPAIRVLELQFARHLEASHGTNRRAQAKIRRLVETSRREINRALRKVPHTRPAGRKKLSDLITFHGEHLSANLLVEVLKEHGVPAFYVDARRCIVTDENHGSAQPLFPQTCYQTQAELRPLLKKKRVPVLGGFIGASRTGATTTMGRGSSDYTATIISAVLGADETQIWTDVDGILTADPKLVPAALTVPRLSYAEAAEIARLGARVLNPRTMNPVIARRIPLRVRNSSAPAMVGTLIGEDADQSGYVKVIVHKPEVTTIEVRLAPKHRANGFLQSIRRAFDMNRVAFEILNSSPDRIVLACADNVLTAPIHRHLSKLGSVKVKPKRSIIACIGSGLGEAGRQDHYLDRFKNLTPRLRWQSTSNLGLVTTVAQDSARATVRSLHSKLFEEESYTSKAPPRV